MRRGGSRTGKNLKRLKMNGYSPCEPEVAFDSTSTCHISLMKEYCLIKKDRL